MVVIDHLFIKLKTNRVRLVSCNQENCKI